MTTGRRRRNQAGSIILQSERVLAKFKENLPNQREMTASGVRKFFGSAIS